MAMLDREEGVQRQHEFTKALSELPAAELAEIMWSDYDEQRYQADLAAGYFWKFPGYKMLAQREIARRLRGET